MLRIAPEKRKLRAVIGEGVDLTMIEFDRTDGLLRRIILTASARSRRKVVCSLCAPIHVAIVVGETARPAFDFRRLAIAVSE